MNRVSINKVILMGNVGGVKFHTMGSGDEMCAVSLATNYYQKDGDTFKTQTDWHEVVVYNRTLVEYAKKNINSGDYLYVVGELRNSEKEFNGVKSKATKILLTGFRGELKVINKSRKEEVKEGAEDDFDFTVKDKKEKKAKKEDKKEGEWNPQDDDETFF